MEQRSDVHKNPSRKTCEDIIRRILMTEVLTKGRNQQFKQANDFMSYFQSLYPSSDSLAKQVQRAVIQMDLPRDENGFLVINKTKEQMTEEKKLSKLLNSQCASLDSLEECKELFLKLDPDLISYTMSQLEKSPFFKGLYVCIIPASNGLLFRTRSFESLNNMLNSLLI